MKKLSAEALDVLGTAIEVDGSHARIGRALDRKVYVEVNAALEALGGAWNRKAKAHVFPGDPTDALDQVLVDGAFSDKKRDLEQFFTPPALAKMVVERASIRGRTVLEPSAGGGALALAALEAGAKFVQCVEKDPGLAVKLRERFIAEPRVFTDCVDFLEFRQDTTFQVCTMNPPFSRQQDIAHVTRAFELVAPGGRLVAIMAAGVSFREDRKSVAFREFVERHGTLEALPPQSFRESGTDVNTVLVVLDK